MEYKNLKLEFKADEGVETGIISGLGSVYGVVDQGGDIVAMGAFDESLASGRSVKMLFQHNPNEPIGIWTDIQSDSESLKVVGKMADTVHAQDILKLVKMGALTGLSIGYRVVEAKNNNMGNRIITKAELWEISVVTFAMLESAVILDAKSKDDKAEIDNSEMIELLKTRIELLKS